VVAPAVVVEETVVVVDAVTGFVFVVDAPSLPVHEASRSSAAAARRIRRICSLTGIFSGNRGDDKTRRPCAPALAC
jgi:hypothetical protein